MNSWLRLPFCLLMLLGLTLPLALAQETTVAKRSGLASAAYRSGDLATARVLWEEELLEGSAALGARARARICYNLGNIALREERPMAGVAWYSASLRLRPRDKDTWSNLELARLNAGLEAADRGDLKATVSQLLTYWTPAESSLLALWGCLPLALAFAFEALRGGRRARWLVFAGLCLAFLTGAPWVHQRLMAGEDSVMVIASEAPRARSEPRSDAPRVHEFKMGEVLVRTDETPGWTEVEGPDGLRGWIRSQEVFALQR